MKMNNDLISVIIPVYNVEKYLEKCLNTVVNQTYKNLEIILVDDGSLDNSSRICDEYSERDERIKVFHKENGGSSDARNYGIMKATGKYIGFIDADDYVDEDMYEKLHDACVKNKCDIAWCDKYLEKENKKMSVQRFCEKPTKLTKEETYKLILLNDASLCDKLFKKEIFDDIKFVVGSLYEDIMPLCYAIDKSEYTYYINEAKYHYIQRDGSNVHHFDLRKLDYTKNANLFCCYVLDRFPNLKDVTDAYYILVLTTLLSDMYLDKNKYKKHYFEKINEINSYKKIYIKNQYIPHFKKFMCFLTIHKMIGLSNFMKKIRNKIKYR